MKKLLFVFLLFMSVWVACKKQDNVEELPPTRSAKISITGFTETDKNGKLVGTVDNTDWINDATWNTDETTLFAFADTANLTGTDTCKVSIQPVYPNAVALNDTITLKVSTTKKVKLSLVVVDEYLDAYTKPVNFTTNAVGAILPIIVTGGTYNSGKSYRVYYGVSAPNHKLFYKGHGDFKVK